MSVNEDFFLSHDNSKVCFDVIRCQILSSIKATMDCNRTEIITKNVQRLYKNT